MEPKIHFVHFRVYDGLIKEYLARSGVTLGFREIESNVIEYAVSYCSPSDLYNKSIGRAIVSARIDDEDTCLIADSTFEQFEAICRSDTLKFSESYTELLDELLDLLSIDPPAAFNFYVKDDWTMSDLRDLQVH
jgi:hypothetical protein